MRFLSFFAWVHAQTDVDERYVLDMLRAAVGAVPGAYEADLIVEACVPETVRGRWTTSFRDAVETMMQKSRRTMQQGLTGVADSIIHLVDGCECGELSSLQRFKEQAKRLRAFSTSRSVVNFDSRVEYEPMKTLVVGGVDLHSELNALLVGWKMNKGPQQTGVALQNFLQEFSEESATELADSAQQSVVDVAVPAHVEQGSPSFWIQALNVAFERMGDASKPVTSFCMTEAVAQRFSAGLEEGFQEMLKKTKRGMQRGLRLIAESTQTLLHDLEQCHAVPISVATRKFRAAIERLLVFATAKTVVNYGAQVEYEAMQGLKVGGIDIHKEVNLFLGAWMFKHGADEVGIGLQEFFWDFADAEDEGIAEEPVDSPIYTMLRDAFAAASSQGDTTVPKTCFTAGVINEFEAAVEGAIDHMLKKRSKTMQQGLKELAAATVDLVGALPAECAQHSGVERVLRGAKKINVLTRKTVVDYGTHIEYEAMKSLRVGGIAMHSELNAFIAAWKLRSKEESGSPFGILMQKCSTIVGHDDL